MKSKNEKWALFWCNLLHPVIFDEIEREQTNQPLTIRGVKTPLIVRLLSKIYG